MYTHKIHFCFHEFTIIYVHKSTQKTQHVNNTNTRFKIDCLEIFLPFRLYYFCAIDWSLSNYHPKQCLYQVLLYVEVWLIWLSAGFYLKDTNLLCTFKTTLLFSVLNMHICPNFPPRVS